MLSTYFDYFFPQISNALILIVSPLVLFFLQANMSPVQLCYLAHRAQIGTLAEKTPKQDHVQNMNVIRRTRLRVPM